MKQNAIFVTIFYKIEVRDDIIRVEARNRFILMEALIPNN